MPDVDEVVTAVTWTKDALTTSGGTTVVTSDQADWHEARDAGTTYPLVRRHALYVSANQIGNYPGADPFSVTVECEGGFSGAASPAAIGATRFYLADHATAASAALDIGFEREAADIVRIDGRWLLGWRCSGCLSIRTDIKVAFTARLLVDTYGMFRLHEPLVTPASGGVVVEGDGRPGMPTGLLTAWNWTARFSAGAHGLVPMLTISFSRG